MKKLRLFIWLISTCGFLRAVRAHRDRGAFLLAERASVDVKGSMFNIDNTLFTAYISRPPYQVATTILGFLSVPGGFTHHGLPFNQEFGDFILDGRARNRRFGGSLGE